MVLGCGFLLINHAYAFSLHLFFVISFHCCLVELIRRVGSNKEIQAEMSEQLLVIARSSQLLYGHKIPKAIYQMKQIRFSLFHFDSILFDNQQLYVIDSFIERGTLRGECECPLLDMIVKNNQKMISRKIRNPILVNRRKYEVFKRLCDLYQVPLCINSVLYFSNCQMDLKLINPQDEIYLYNESDLECFFQKIDHVKVNKEKFKNEVYESLEPILYFLLSLRYLDYLRQFYLQLSNVKKVSLRNTLSVSSQLMFNLMTQKEARALQQIEVFLGQNRQFKEQGIVQIQMKLFDEIEGWAHQQQESDFIPFNFTSLLFSEGYCLNKSSGYYYCPSTTLN